MSAWQLTERRRRAWAFAMIVSIWVVTTLAVVYQVAPKTDTNTAARRTALQLNAKVVEAQQTLMARYEALSQEIKQTRFQTYQMYVVIQLRQSAAGLKNLDGAVAQQSLHAATILNLLVDAKEELVAKEHNLRQIGDQVQQCREGNRDLQQ